MEIVTDDYVLRFRRMAGYVRVTGDSDSLDKFTSTVTLAGASEGAQEPNGVVVEQSPTDDVYGVLRASDGTVALFLEFEVLNYL